MGRRLRLVFVVVMLATIGVVIATTAFGGSRAPTRLFAAPLAGVEEVPAIQTDATGVAAFRLSPNGKRLHYVIHVANIEGAVQAHIHLAQRGENGEVVAFLFGPSDPVSQTGVLARGSFTRLRLIGELEGRPLSALINAIRSGRAYVNVHTTANPGGEIRGQIVPLNLG